MILANRRKKQRKRRTEQAYVLDAYKRIRSQGVPSLWEAPLLGRSVDLLFQQNGNLITVEFKLKNWRRGITQARDHRLGGDYAYVCMAGTEPTNALREAVVDAGVGLFVFIDDSDWPFRIEVPAPRSTITWNAARENLRRLLKLPDR